MDDPTPAGEASREPGGAGGRDQADYPPMPNIFRRGLRRLWVNLRLALLKSKHRGLTFGKRPRIDFARVSFDTRPGPVSFGDHCIIMGGHFMGLVEVGDWVQFARPDRIGGSSKYKVTIGSRCMIGTNTHIVPSTHNYRRRDLPIRDQGTHGADIVIGEDCWIGVNTVISPGVTIGRGAVVGANSVVTRDVPEYAIVAGSPVRPIGQRA